MTGEGRKIVCRIIICNTGRERKARDPLNARDGGPTDDAMEGQGNDGVTVDDEGVDGKKEGSCEKWKRK